MLLLAGYQDKTVLRNVYGQIYQWNRSLMIDPRMEELAQSHGCVRTHADHSGSWQDDEILNKYFNIASIIACVGGCRESASNWSRAKPAQIWYEFRHQTGHYDTILNNNRVGCSVEVSGKDYCVYCTFANQNKFFYSILPYTVPYTPTSRLINPLPWTSFRG